MMVVVMMMMMTTTMTTTTMMMMILTYILYLSTNQPLENFCSMFECIDQF